MYQQRDPRCVPDSLLDTVSSAPPQADQNTATETVYGACDYEHVTTTVHEITVVLQDDNALI